MAQFTSAVLGAVGHPTNILAEYLSQFRGIHKFKAYILSWLDGWMATKLKQGKSPWVYVVLGELAQALGCCRDTVHRHLQELCELGYVSRLPYKRWPTDNIWQYTINLEQLQEELKESTSDENQTAESPKPECPQSDSGPPTVQNSAAYINTDSSPTETPTTPTTAVVDEDVKRLPDQLGMVDRELVLGKTLQPDRGALNEVYQELRTLPLSRGFKINPTIEREVKRHFPQAKQALSYLQQAIRTWKVRPDFNWEGLFVKALKREVTSEEEINCQPSGLPEPIRPPNLEQLGQLDDAKGRGEIHDYFLSGDGITKVVMPKNFAQMPWWEFLPGHI